ncbi:50S ribosomal protein L24 [Patescibacteria group bacterium]|nr:50S ribosomal protein L24 [Patescibacteria group bacterium]
MATHPVKTGDTVEVIAGKYRGKTGKVLQVFPRLERVSVQGINLMKRHMRSRRAGDKGQIVQFPMPIHLSNVRMTSAADSSKEASSEATTEAPAKKKPATRKAKT